MGAVCGICSKSQEHETMYDLTTRENLLIDSLVIPAPNCSKLKYLNDFQNKFNVLRFFQLVDFINLLNTFRPDSNGENSSHSQSFKDSMINKDDWMRFINSKILKSPIIPEYDSTEDSLQSQFYDDVFDCLLRSYKYFFDAEHNFIPKIMVISFVFNYCGRKISQKIDLIFNLFANEEGKFAFTNNVYAFLYCLITFAFDFPTEFLHKFHDPDHNKKYYGINSAKDFEPFSNVEKRDNICREFFVRETKIIFGEDEKKTYDKTEFKNMIMDTEKGGAWIIDNGILRTRMEQNLKD